MFEFLRRMIVPIMIIALVGFLATIVFQWGMDISSRRNYEAETTAAVINGEEVTWQEFNRVYDRLYQAQIQGSDEDLSDYRKKELRNSAWQQILHDHLIMQQVARYGITVSEEELYQFLKYAPPPDIQQMTFFQTDGVFDYQKYLSAMADPSAASFWATVEPIMQNEILKQKLQAMVIQTAQVSQTEVLDEFLAGTEKVKVGLVNVPFSRFDKSVTASDEDLRNYYNEHSEDYTVEERAVINLVQLSKAPQEYDWEIDSAKAAQLYDSVTTGADFVELARFYSEDANAEAGGDLGWFRQGQMVEPFDKKVFSMKPGEVSGPVRTQFGWHIIQVHEFRDTTDGSQKVREAHASHILLKVTASAETLDRIHKQLDDFKMYAAEYGFATAAEEKNLEMLTTGPFTDGGAIDHLGYDPTVNEFAFNNEVGTISPVLENRSWAYVAELVDRLPAGQAAFDDVKDRVTRDYETYTVKGLCHDTAAAIYGEVQQGKDIEKAASAHGAKYAVSDEFDRKSYIRGLGVAPEAVGAAFSLTEPGQVTPPVDYARGTVLMKLIERKSPETAEFAAKRDSLYQAIMATKQQELYGAWFDDLVKKSEIINNIEDAVFEGGN